MTLVLANRVYETSTTTGTGTLSLSGAPTGFRTFVSGVGDGAVVPYLIDDGTDWELGIGTVTSGSPDTLSRDTILDSSNGGSAVNFSSGTKNVRLTLPASKHNLLDLGTAVASTSGTAIDFTNLPTGVKRVTINFDEVSTNGSDAILIQIGDSGGIETTGYISTSIRMVSGNTALSNNSTSGVIIDYSHMSQTISGRVVFELIDESSNQWSASYVLKNASTAAIFGAGSKSLSAVLDRVRITTTSGTDTFDNGKINITYER